MVHLTDLRRVAPLSQRKFLQPSPFQGHSRLPGQSIHYRQSVGLPGQSRQFVELTIHLPGPPTGGKLEVPGGVRLPLAAFATPSSHRRRSCLHSGETRKALGPVATVDASTPEILFRLACASPTAARLPRLTGLAVFQLGLGERLEGSHQRMVYLAS